MKYQKYVTLIRPISWADRYPFVAVCIGFAVNKQVGLGGEDLCSVRMWDLGAHCYQNTILTNIELCL
jgi:hypothetical protein